MKHDNIETQLQGLQHTLLMLHGLLDRVQGTPASDAPEVAPERKGVSLEHVLGTADARIADFRNQAENIVEAITTVLFDDTQRT